MRIVDFARRHMEEAAALAVRCYEEERRHVPCLPPVEHIPDPMELTGNRLGVAAFDGKKMVGFLCGRGPFENAFGSTDVHGVFSPMGANGAVRENRGEIYGAMYQAAAEKWVQAGAASHALCLYAHDERLQRQFYLYGFGCRCMDGIRPLKGTCVMEEDGLTDAGRSMGPEPEWSRAGYGYRELSGEEWEEVYPLALAMNRHFRQSPFFLDRRPPGQEEFRQGRGGEGYRYFGARRNGQLCAFLQTGGEGETFLTQKEGYVHITGAYCLPEHRGNGMFRTLVDHAASVLSGEGYAYLGVDFESINPAAYGFWKKDFHVYTHGVARRIDERIFVGG